MKNFKEAVIYQVYPKSFYDSNGDGIGDIRGIIEKLDYIKELGADYIWSTPFFVSPQKDNGYDVADYRNIDPLFGTMEDVEELIKKAGKLDIGIMLDMVFNHTSTEHEWFKKALAGDSKYMNYYIFKDGKDGKAPTNWQSKFGGSAWEYVESLDKWYLHLFDVSQADLNWDNPELRNELKEVLRFWKDKGVSGFRFDVINLVSKPDVFEDDFNGDGRRFYTDGPRIHEYLKELVKDTGIKDYVTVGEMSSTSIENCIRYANPDEEELSMCFNFHHLKVDYKDGNKWELMNPDYKALKDLFEIWQTEMAKNNAWNALFWCNHDQPRIVSRFGNEKDYLKESAKMLATCIHLLRGTPYIYQGEELGMTNPHYEEIEKYKDVESINYYNILLELGKTKKEALDILKNRSRDNSRTPMQWNDGENAGFSTVSPWISLSDNYTDINVEKQIHDKTSVFRYYKKLIELRKKYKVIQEGDIEFLYQDNNELFAYKRSLGNEKISVLNNLGSNNISLDIDFDKYEYILGNYDERDMHDKILRPYESIVLYRTVS